MVFQGGNRGRQEQPFPFYLRGAGGIIFSDIIGTRFQVEETLSSGIPCVVINNYVEDLPVSCIAIDNAGGAENAVNYLISLGHKNIAHITGDVSTQAAAKRLEGYQQALKPIVSIVELPSGVSFFNHYR